LPVHLHFLLWVGTPTFLAMAITFLIVSYFSSAKRFENHVRKMRGELSMVIDYFDLEESSYENLAVVLGKEAESGIPLDDLVRRASLVKEAFVIDRSGIILFSVPRTLLYDVSNFREFKRITESFEERGRCYDFIEPGEVGFWYRGKDGKVYLFYFVRQRAETVFCGGLPVMKIGRNGLRYVFWRSTNISKKEVFEVYARVEENLPSLLDGECVEAVVGKERWFFLSQKDPRNGEVYFLAFPVSYVYSDVFAFSSHLLLSFLVVLPFLALTLLVVSTVFRRQISKVMKLMEKLGRGDFDLLEDSVLRRFPYELRVIGESVNRLSKELQKNFEVIAEQNEELTSQAEELKALTLELSVQNKRLIQADKTKRKFLSFVSHELRTPLNSLLGMSAVLESRLSDPKNRMIVSHIKSASNRMLELVNQVLELTKLELRAYSLSIYPVDLV